MAELPTSAAPLPPPPTKPRPFRRAVLRGLALILPPVLTIVTLLWVASTVQVYVLQPVTDGARQVLVWCLSDVRFAPDDAAAGKPTLQFDGRVFQRLDSGQYVPSEVVAGVSPLPPNARVAYEQYVSAHFLQPIDRGAGLSDRLRCRVVCAWQVVHGESGQHFRAGRAPLPLIRGVYASVKKVTDFALVDSGEVHYLRVVAIEFPRPGIWTVGLVTGEGMTDIAGAAGEPCVTVAVPGSPVPFTGNVVTVPKSAAHDLSITIDESLQFFISCGVVVPLRELQSKEGANSSGKLPALAASRSGRYSPAASGPTKSGMSNP